MDELTSILEQIKKYNKIIIHRHQLLIPMQSLRKLAWLRF